MQIINVVSLVIEVTCCRTTNKVLKQHGKALNRLVALTQSWTRFHPFPIYLFSAVAVILMKNTLFP